jgi:hypothetical protein
VFSDSSQNAHNTVGSYFWTAIHTMLVPNLAVVTSIHGDGQQVIVRGVEDLIPSDEVLFRPSALFAPYLTSRHGIRPPR